MTNRLNAFVIVLDRDIREDDAQPIFDAIKMIRGVLEVEPLVRDVDSLIAHARVRNELIGKLLEIMRTDPIL